VTVEDVYLVVMASDGLGDLQIEVERFSRMRYVHGNRYQPGTRDAAEHLPIA
jgi:hypothetical protein